MKDNLLSRLRDADEHTVALAMDRACVGWPINNRAELLEAFNCILDQLDVPDGDGDVFEPDE